MEMETRQSFWAHVMYNDVNERTTKHVLHLLDVSVCISDSSWYFNDVSWLDMLICMCSPKVVKRMYMCAAESWCLMLSLG